MSRSRSVNPRNALISWAPAPGISPLFDFPASYADASRRRRVFLTDFLHHQETDGAAEVKGETAALQPTAVGQTEATPPCEDEDEEEAPAEVTGSLAQVGPGGPRSRSNSCSFCVQTLSPTLLTNQEPPPEEATPPTGRNPQQGQISCATMVTGAGGSTYRV